MSLFRQSQSSAASSLLQMMYIYSSSTHYLLQASIELIELLLTIITQRGEKKKEKKRRRSNPKTKETMESAGAIMEGGEWSSFNGVYISEEANFMAQLFPTNCSLPTDNVADEDSSLACWSNDFTMTTNSNLYCSFSQESCYTGGSGIVTYPTAGHDNYYACDTDSTHRFLAANKMLIEFHEDNKERPGEVEDADDNDLLLKRESDISGSSVISKKRSRPSDVPKGKRNATRSKKRQKAGSVEEDKNGGVLNRQSSSSYNSEEESNLSLELNNGGATSSSVLNSNGKTRASRGSATDPQSLYARKRRERINERLRTLQNLVPNGTKVDISTMLEEAVQYVKFLQLQIKLMSSEDLWMYAPIAYNGMDIGLDFKFNAPK